MFTKRYFFLFIIILSLFVYTNHYYVDEFFFNGPENYSLKKRLNEEIAKNFNYPFSYLGQGNQIISFLSFDHKYVLKIFKFGHLKPSWSDYFRTQPNLKAHRKMQQSKIKRIFEAYELGYNIDKDHSALEFIHLEQTQNNFPIIKITDRFGFSHSLPLDDCYFVIQKKGVQTKTVLKSLLDHHKTVEAVDLLKRLLRMYRSEYKRGLLDKDHNILVNTGFIGERPFHLDIGKITFNDEIKSLQKQEEDLNRILRRIDLWLNKYYPKYSKQIIPFLKYELNQADK